MACRVPKHAEGVVHDDVGHPGGAQCEHFAFRAVDLVVTDLNVEVKLLRAARIGTGLLFPFLPGDTLPFTAGMIAAQATTPVDIRTLTPCTALAAVFGAQCAYIIGRRVGRAL